MDKILTPANPVFIVDDETNILKSYEIILKKNGINNVHICQDSREVMGRLKKQEMELVLLDLTLPYIRGDELLPLIVEEQPDLPVIIVTGNNKIETAVQCTKQGAFDYIVKPVEEGRLVNAVKLAIGFRNLLDENVQLKQRIFSKELDRPEAFADIITENSRMQSIFQYTEAIARSSEPVLVTGETGVGKELTAHSFHILSGRAGKFMTVNVAGLDDHLFSDTLFGHKKGAFTDAYQERKGLVEQAAGGTLFLDEIGDLSAASQVKLLRLLQENEFYPLGSDMPRYSDVRVIAATNQDIYVLQESGKFRKDLFYRLKVHHVHIPPLRERADDLPLLIDHFLEEAARDLGKKKPTPPPELPVLLSTYHFPGNIRELRSMVFDAVSTHRSKKLSMEKFKMLINKNKPENHIPTAESSKEVKPLLFFGESLPTLKQAQQLLVREAMKRSKDNQSIAAGILGITRQALNKRIKEEKERASAAANGGFNNRMGRT
ncbi:MAG: sigma-54-dependent Fis family transcriptional regulator [Candidatus Aminicenantes bacterium]|nr:sigma-54-dependent Fis family transcriptional regulator [Candidatus Aminicenantes bacterium]